MSLHVHYEHLEFPAAHPQTREVVLEIVEMLLPILGPDGHVIDLLIDKDPHRRLVVVSFMHDDDEQFHRDLVRILFDHQVLL